MITIYTYRYIFLLYKDIHNALKRKKQILKQSMYPDTLLFIMCVCVHACIHIKILWLRGATFGLWDFLLHVLLFLLISFCNDHVFLLY